MKVTTIPAFGLSRIHQENIIVIVVVVAVVVVVVMVVITVIVIPGVRPWHPSASLLRTIRR